MKKLILPLLLLVGITMLVAVESNPSAVVGYFKISAPVAQWTPVSVPFKITNGSALNIFGSNWASSADFEVADQIVDPYNGATTNYYTGYDWDNVSTDYVLPGHIYWVNRTQASASTDFFLLGEVDSQPFTLVMNGQDMGGWTPISINDASGINPNSLGFTTAAPDFDNNVYDRIVCQNDGRTAEFYGSEYGGWNSLDGAPFLLEPSNAYYYYSNLPTSWNWSFVPIRNASPGSTDINSGNSRRSK